MKFIYLAFLRYATIWGSNTHAFFAGEVGNDQQIVSVGDRTGFA